MENPFNLSDEKLRELMAGYSVWLESDQTQKQYPGMFRKQSEDIRKGFLDLKIINGLSDEVLYDKIFKYTRTLEGPAYIPLGEPRVRDSLQDTSYRYLANGCKIRITKRHKIRFQKLS